MNVHRSAVATALASAYRVERELGRGATAIVFLGEDIRHQRKVAIKVLRDELAEALGAERFLQEILLSARLAHPHIVPLLDSGERGGFVFYVMPAIEGETLRERLERDKRLGIPEAMRFTSQLADALSYAHEQHIVHRDVKPENVLISRSGHALMLDFGIALAITASGVERITATGFSLGTPAYMSPEQAAGEREVDARSDQYSLAMMCFEMLTGEAAFAGPSLQASLMRRFTEAAPSARERRPELGVVQDEALRRAMSVDPDHRFATTAEFVAALLGSPTAANAAAGAAAVATPVVAVLPLHNQTSDPENQFLADGIAEEILSALSQVKGLRMIGRSSSFAFRGQAADLRTIADTLRATHVLSGSMRRAGNKLRVSAELVNATDGQVVWSQKYDREMTDVFAIQDEIAAAVADALRIVLAPPSTRPTHTPNLAAHELFLRGRSLYLLGPARYVEARALIDRGLAMDPASMVGQSLLAGFLANTGVFGMSPPHEAFPQAKAILRTVLDQGPDAFALYVQGMIAMFYDWDLPHARRWLGESLRFSERARAMHAFAMSLAGDFTGAAAEAAQALIADPFELNNRFMHVDVLRFSRRAADALTEARRAIELFPQSSHLQFQLAQLLGAAGEADEALTWARKSAAGRHALGTAVLVGLLADRGETAEARALLEAATAQAAVRFVSPVSLGLMHAALGERDAALTQFEIGVTQVDPFMVTLRRDPMYDRLRDEPRFDAVLTAVGI